MKDYSKIKALASQILECIGDEDEGGDGTDVSHSEDERGGPECDDMSPAASSSCSEEEESEEGAPRKKRKDDCIALMASTLASKFNK